MTNARDKANIPVLNFQSKGIDDNADATAITIDSSEQIGFGTSSPNAELHISKSGNGNTTELILENTFTASGSTDETTQLQSRFGGYDASYIITGKEEDFTTSANRSSFMSFTTRKDGTLSEKLRITSGGLVGIGTGSGVDKELHVQASDGSAEIRIENSAHTVRLDLSALQDTTGLNTIGSHPIFFKIASSEKMRLTSTGLGIGTSAPATPLHISGTNPTITFQETDQSNRKYQIGTFGAAYSIYDETNTQFRYVLDTNGNHIFNEGSQDCDFRVESNGNANMLFVDGGNDRVGIGTASPVSKLTVAGQITATGGAVSAPTYAFDNDTDTGISRPTTNAINFVTAGAERMRITSAGNFGIGTSSPSQALEVNGTIIAAEKILIGSATTSGKFAISTNAGSVNRMISLTDTGNAGGGRDYIEFFNVSGGTAGSIEHNGTSTVAFLTSSDYRLKENVSYDFDATTRLKQLKPARFNFITDADITVDGFLAHEVSSVVPEAISGTKDAVDADGNPDYQGIDQSKLVPLLVKTIQELEARITTLETTTP